MNTPFYGTMIKCSICGREGVTAWITHRCEAPAVSVPLPRSGRTAEVPAAPANPRNSTQSPSRRKPRKESGATKQPRSKPSLDQIHDKPDTAPSVTNTTDPVTNIPSPVLLTDDQLKPFYNEWMRRKMANRRSGPK